MLYSDLWRSISQILDDLTDIHVVKVKANLKCAHVMDGTVSCAQWLGNSVADKWAKAECDEASRAAPCTRVRSQWLLAASRYRWLVRVVADWKYDTASSAPLVPPSSSSHQEVQPRTFNRLSAGASHELSRSTKRGWCHKC